ncbi:hypothetical protein C2845_PM14G07260 [Panicum miliaceum]|uniref:Uncharacterized protein n=1 Tax=Panicum miliaceum TaxID=4540 RepID=A0A3L6PNS5_PANMI|nr:hypothetical protein C2845_PM14G07260 [Panicum miliaceum]
MPNVTMRAPSAPPHRQKTNCMANGMTGVGWKERVKDTRRVRRGQVNYRFHTTFHQDFYESAILKKGVPISHSQFIDLSHLKKLGDPILIEECKKRVYKIMGFQHNWNREVIAQFYATCYFDVSNDMRRVHWMTG